MPEIEDKKGPGRPKESHICRVYWQNVAPENANDPIKVHVIAKGEKRKYFLPGEEVRLTNAQLESLKNAVIDNQIEIPMTSGILKSKNPKQEAEEQYPGFKAVENLHGGLTVIRSNPRFIVEVLD